MHLIINDGYTLEGTIPGRKGLDPLKFRFRPCLTHEIEEWRYKTNYAKSGKDKAESLCEFVAAHLVIWDVVGPDGVNVPISKESVGRLPPRYVTDIFAIIADFDEAEDEKN